MRKLKLCFTCILFLAASLFAYAQNINVSGMVSDASTGEGIPFASIQVKGTMNGTATDADGNYSISVPKNAILIVSSIGYLNQEVAVESRTIINVIMAVDTESLEETVVVAYGTAKKSSFTGSATAVKSENLNKRTVSNVSKAIEGLVAGVTSTAGSGQPGESAALHIRGYGSINASSTPLYVVDGIPYDGALSAINPADIENLTVLKDASASALYGARGANGVVMITTRRGDAGFSNVNFKAQFGFQSRSLKRYDMLSQDEFVEITWEALRNSSYYAGKSMADAGAYASGALGAQLGGEFYNPYKNYTWDQVVDPATGKVKSDAKSVWNEDWMDILTNNQAYRQDYQVGITGGTEKTKYNLSAGYLNDRGVLITTKFDRYSVRGGVDHTVNKWMQLGGNLSYAYTDSNSSQYSSTQTGNAWYTAQFMAPIYPVYLKDDSGKDALDENGQRQYDYGTNGRPKAARFNVVGDLYENHYKTKADNASIRSYAILGGNDPVMGALKGVSFSLNFGADIRNRAITSYYNPYHGDGASTSGEVDKYATRTMSYTFNQILKYDRKFGAHHLLAQAGHEWYNYNYTYLYAERTGVYPGIYELNPATNVTDNASYAYDYRIESWFGRLNYDFADKYYLEATWRTDGSSRFYKDNRWGQFWSLGGSWRISEENFMKTAGWVDNLTLRLSYGQLGNDDLSSYYAWQSFYNLTWPNAGNPGAIVTSLENKNVSWEKKSSWNAGIEGSFFNRFLNLTAEFYHQTTTDMLLSFPMPLSTGFSGYNANVGSMRNIGFEATLRFNWINRQDIRFSSTFMGYKNKNTVLALTDTDVITSGSQVIKVGMPIYTFYMPKSAGVDPETGKLLYWTYEYERDDNGQVKRDANGVEIIKAGSEAKTDESAKATASKYYLGSREPKFQGSFGSDLQWKSFDFSFLTTFSVGGLVYDSPYASSMEVSYAGDTWNRNILKRWRNPGDDTDVPAVLLGSGRVATDRWLIDASYFAIKSVQFGYTLPQKWTRKAGMKALRIFATGDNIFMFNKLAGMDPQYNFSGGTSWAYTPTRTFSLGLDINF